MRTVGAFEAKTKLSALLAEVALGEEIVITRHGVAIARLVPAGPSPRLTRKETVRKLLAFRNGRSLRGITIRSMIDQGRR